MSDPKILKIAVPVPLAGLFDYLPPAGTDIGLLSPGCRLRVPFGRKHLVGMLVGVEPRSELASHRLKRAEALLDDVPIIHEPLLGLLRWAARYYQHPVGEVFEAALPRLLRTGRAAAAQDTRWFATTAGVAEDLEALRRRAPRQAAVLDALRNAETGSEREELANCGGDWAGALRALARKKLCETAPFAQGRRFRGPRCCRTGADAYWRPSEWR